MAQGDQTIFSKEIQAFADQAQALDNAIQDVYNLRGVYTATGMTLDYVGDQVGCTRPAGMSDTNFQDLILAQIQMNASGGEPERLIAAIAILTGATIIKYTDYYCMVSIEFNGTAISNLWTIIKRIVAGGIALRLVNSSNPFLFDSATNGLDNGFLGNVII